MEIRYSPTPAHTAAHELQKALQTAAGTDILLLLSGGSWFSVLALVDTDSVLNNRTTVGCVDERFSPDPAINNYRQLQSNAFHARATARGVRWLDSSVRDGETHRQFSDRFAAQIDDWRVAYPDGLVVVTLGMGEDGHTAGIFPHSPALTSPETALGYEVATGGVLCPQRTTVTAAFLEGCVTRAVAYVAGPDKCHCLTVMLQDSQAVSEIPAQLWHHLPLTLVTDCPEATERT